MSSYARSFGARSDEIIPRVPEAEAGAGLDVLDRIVVRIDVDYRTFRGTYSAHACSGVLVRIGGVTFVLTSGLTLLERKPRDVSVTFQRFGPKAERATVRIASVHATWSPDVGAIELDAFDERKWSHMSPLTDADFARAAPRDGERVLLLGALGGDPHGGVAIRTSVAAATTRGFDVQYGPRLALHWGGRTIAAPSPSAIRGGPVLSYASRPMLLGIASAIAGTTLACETSSALVELLAAHPSESVRRAVDRL